MTNPNPLPTGVNPTIRGDQVTTMTQRDTTTMDDTAVPALAVTPDSVVDDASESNRVVFEVDELAVYYGEFKAVREVVLDVHAHEVTAFIGPSGCGKSTVLRCFNRMNDTIPGARVEGHHQLSRHRPLRR